MIHGDEHMPALSQRLLGYVVVVTGFLSLAFGLTTLSVLDYFGLEGAPAADVAAFLNQNLSLLQASLMAAMVGYVIAVPMMLIITAATFRGEAPRGWRGDFALGLVWASLPLRPLWWAALITLMPALLAASRPDADPDVAQTTFVTYQMVSSAELFGLQLGTSGNIIPLVAGVAGPFWLGAARILAVRKIT